MQAFATDVFVSYKAEDRARIEPLVAALEAEGFSVWWDAHIGAGTNWHEDIERHLDAAKCVIVAWSKRSIGHDGHFVRDEARRAQRRSVYLPIRLDAVDPPLGFGEVQALSLKGWRGDRSDPSFLTLSNAVRECITGEHSARRAVPRSKDGISRRTAIAGGAVLGAGAIAGGGSWLLRRPAAANAKRIAVMPFANMSGADQAYFIDGIAEELRSALARIGLEVIGRTSSDAVKNLDAKAAASKLDAANILTGSVRRSSDTIRINAQLVSGKDGVERWAQSYDRAPGDAIKIQTDIAQNVAQALSIALGPAVHAAITLGGTADPVAQDLVLQANQISRTAGSGDDLRRAIALTEAAIDRDPRFARAWMNNAMIHRRLANTTLPSASEVANQLAQAHAAAQKAIVLTPTWGQAYEVLSAVESARLDFASALRMAKRGLALSPDDSAVLTHAAGIIVLFDGPETGLPVANRAVALDPLNGGPYESQALALAFGGQYRQAIETGRKQLSLSPKASFAHVLIGDSFLLLGQPAQARREYEALDPTNDGYRPARLALLAARTGDQAGAEQQLAEMKRVWGAGSSYQYAEIYAQLGDRDHAFAELDAAAGWKDGGLNFLKFDPFFDPIRGDPRYAALIRRLNFP
jgi:TolB-like protein